jgi:NADH-quinone oxidoreductase subunit A
MTADARHKPTAWHRDPVAPRFVTTFALRPDVGKRLDAALLGSRQMLSDFAPILVFLAVCVAFGAGVQALSSWLGPRRPSPAKDLPYECGIVPVETARRRFSVSFYVTAMLFIIFDVESIFLLPWATVVRQLKIFGIVEMGIFIATLLIGLVYVWAKGALRWD